MFRKYNPIPFLSTLLMALSLTLIPGCATDPRDSNLVNIESKYTIRFDRRRIKEERIARFRAILDSIKNTESPYSRIIDGVEYGVMVNGNNVVFRHRDQAPWIFQPYQIIPMFLYDSSLASIDLAPSLSFHDSFHVRSANAQASVDLPDGLYWYHVADPHNPYIWYEGVGENPIFIVGDLSDDEFSDELTLYMAGADQDFWIRERD